MDKTKADILREQSAAEVMRWIQRNPELADAEVAEHFNKLARQAFLDRYGDPNFLPSPRRKEKTK